MPGLVPGIHVFVIARFDRAIQQTLRSEIANSSTYWMPAYAGMTRRTAALAQAVMRDYM